MKDFLDNARIGAAGLLIIGSIAWLCDSRFYRQYWEEFQQHRKNPVDYVVFSNDGPLGSVVNEVARMPGYLTACWDDSTYLGNPYMPLNGAISRGVRVVGLWPVYQVVFLALAVMFITCAIASDLAKTDWPVRCFYAGFAFAGLVVIITTIALLARGDIDYDSMWFASSAFVEMLVWPMLFLALDLDGEKPEPCRQCGSATYQQNLRRYRGKTKCVACANQAWQNDHMKYPVLEIKNETAC